MNDKNDLLKIEIVICEKCLNGEGDECHVPGCALFLHAVDIPVHPELYKILERFPEEKHNG